MSERLFGRQWPNATSVVSFPLPFARRSRGLLIVLNDQGSSIRDAYSSVGMDLLLTLNVICLRRRELFQLSMPGSNVATFSLPYWVKGQGEVVHGADIRNEIVAYAHPKRLLIYHLEWLRSTRQGIVQLLMRRDYGEVVRSVDRERSSLMYTALLTRNIWHVYPSTVATVFRDVFSHCELENNLKYFAETLNLNSRIGANQQVGYRALWLLEELIDVLSRAGR